MKCIYFLLFQIEKPCIFTRPIVATGMSFFHDHQPLHEVREWMQDKKCKELVRWWEYRRFKQYVSIVMCLLVSKKGQGVIALSTSDLFSRVFVTIFVWRRTGEVLVKKK